MALSAPIVVTPLIASSCSKFNLKDLGTWGDKQKKEANIGFFKYFSSVDLNQTWQNALNDDALESGITLALTEFDPHQRTLFLGENINYTWNKNYSGSLKSLFAQGVTATFKGYPAFGLPKITGSVSITFQHNF